MPLLQKVNRFLALPLAGRPRLLLVLAALLLAAIYVLPLWDMTMFAPQYPDGLRLHIYGHGLVGGNGGQDVREINLLNHYIGMHDLAAEDFPEFRWMPFLVGALGLLFLRAAVHGTMAQLVDVVVLYFYFALFSLGSFAFRLWIYGHRLAPTAPVRVDPFMPPLFGHRRLANFDVYSYPAAGSYVFAAVALVLVIAFVLAWRRRRLAVEAAEAVAA
jgi:copper chaperone NosL